MCAEEEPLGRLPVDTAVVTYGNRTLRGVVHGHYQDWTVIKLNKSVRLGRSNDRVSLLVVHASNVFRDDSPSRKSNA